MQIDSPCMNETCLLFISHVQSAAVMHYFQVDMHAHHYYTVVTYTQTSQAPVTVYLRLSQRTRTVWSICHMYSGDRMGEHCFSDQCTNPAKQQLATFVKDHVYTYHSAQAALKRALIKQCTLPNTSLSIYVPVLQLSDQIREALPRPCHAQINNACFKVWISFTTLDSDARAWHPCFTSRIGVPGTP